MSFTWLIDGYNLLGALGLIQGTLPPAGLHKNRLFLLNFLADRFGEKAPQVLVVFDAARSPRRFAAQQEHRGIQVLFAKGRDEADDLIEELLKDQKRPGAVRLVSGDHRLQRAAQLAGQGAYDCQAFLDELEREVRPQNAQQASEDKVPPTAAENAHWRAVFTDLAEAKEAKELFDSFGAPREDLDRPD